MNSSRLIKHFMRVKMSENLSKELENALKYSDEVQMPSYITSNLNKELREYQVKALQHYFLQRKKPQTNHLMFNMATGSGKTLIMAALMLECYKKGYKNFVFFVNSNAILEKTKANFCDDKSAKYLFNKEIIIDEKRVVINAVANLDECRDYAINIYFSTIQGLYSLFTNERENAITLADLQDKKLVFLADEAHHLNANTKKQNEEDTKSGWEGVIKEAFASHKENLLFEFSATIPNEKAVKDKYKDKIIFEYALKEFCKNGYSKRINVMKYDNDSVEKRMLGAILLSLYRQCLASKNKLVLKPVVLFKSESIKESKANEEVFLNIIENLSEKDIRSFYETLQGENENHLLKSKVFFKDEFEDNFSHLVPLIKNNFHKHKIINVNDEAEAIKNQILLNNLEEKDNEIRVIFAVDKLNEGWDVLNLFDIVRLGNAKSNANTTTKEAQLIGRGARYYPFALAENDEKFKRKYDNDLTQELSMLERLTYHTINDVQFIEMLNSKMSETGLFVEFEEENIVLTPSQRAKELTNDKYILYFVGNTRYKIDQNLYKKDKENLSELIKRLDIPLFSNKVKEYALFEDKIQQESERKKFEKNKIAYNVFLKAFNVNGFEFNKLKQTFNIKSKREFFELITTINLQFDKRQEFDRENQLKIAKFILFNVKNVLIKTADNYEVSEFKKKELKMDKRVILRQKDGVKDSPQWLYYDKYSVDSDLEREFVNFIDGHKADIDKAFKKWIVFRNEGFNEFKLFDNRQNEATYGFGFEPDFIFFGARNERDKFLRVQGIFEVKGEIFTENDRWKESLLKIINGEYSEGINDTMQVKGFPFFVKEKGGGYKREFCDEFELFIKAD